MANPVPLGGSTPPPQGSGASYFDQSEANFYKINQTRPRFNEDTFDTLSETVFEKQGDGDYGVNDAFSQVLAEFQNEAGYRKARNDNFQFLSAMGMYNPKSSDDEDMGVASVITDIPTSSSNWKRPRTVAAGWDRKTQTLTVVFRDGTFWNYYNVPRDVWIRFHDSFSKGPMLNHKSSKQSFEGDLLAYSNGAADISQMTEEEQALLYGAARAAQIMYREKTPRVNKATGKNYRTQGTSKTRRYTKRR